MENSLKRDAQAIGMSEEARAMKKSFRCIAGGPRGRAMSKSPW
jgi:hypothetical protein